MRTLGIDLASQPKHTAICEIDWEAGVVVTLRHGSGLDDEFLSAAIRNGPAKTGIDAPFGWPEPFVRAVSGAAPWPHGSRKPYERRTTDFWVHERIGKLPMSVSTDRIAYCAMRCAILLGEDLGPRDGSGPVVEAYPDAALRVWVPDGWTSYKRANWARRAVLVAALRDAIDLTPEQRRSCIDSDDCLDALVCALVARAAALGETIGPQTPEQQRLANVEGWIHLPRAGSLSRLAAPGRTKPRSPSSDS